MTLTVANPVVFNGPVVNVESFGAIGDGKTDDTAGAFAASGNYRRWKADERDCVCAGRKISRLTNQPGIGTTTWGWPGKKTVILENPRDDDGSMRHIRCFWLSSNSEVKNLTLDSNNVAIPVLVYGRFLTNVNLTDVTLDAHLNQYFDIHGDQFVTFEDCNMIGSGSFLGTASQVFIRWLTNFMEPTTPTRCCIPGGARISASRIAPPRTWITRTGIRVPVGRTVDFFVGDAIWGTESDVYIADNTTIDLGVRPTFTESELLGEQIMFETQFMAQQPNAKFVSATANTLKMTGLTSGFTGAGYEAVIVAGDGVGEHVQITGYNAATGVITLAWGRGRSFPMHPVLLRLAKCLTASSCIKIIFRAKE